MFSWDIKPRPSNIEVSKNITQQQKIEIMKLFTSILFTFSTAQDSVSLRPEPRVYWQLSKMMTIFNPDFSSKKYWLYGCNCVMLGNNQSSSSIEKLISHKSNRQKFLLKFKQILRIALL